MVVVEGGGCIGSGGKMMVAVVECRGDQEIGGGNMVATAATMEW